jgi:hypothetical protein
MMDRKTKMTLFLLPYAALVASMALIGMLLPGAAWGQHTPAKAPAAPHTATAPHPAAAPHAAAPATAHTGTSPTARTSASPTTRTSASPTTHTAAGTTAGRPGSTARPPAAGRTETVRTPNGSTVTHTARGGEITRAPNGRVTSYRSPSGREVHFSPNGRVREVHGPGGMVVSRGPAGMRRTVIERPDHSRFVAYGHGRGYIARPYYYGGHSYYSRAYYYHGGYYRAYYHPYYYHGVYLHGYIPAYYYPAPYYAWAYNPWPAPAPYRWAWAGYPWYGYYGPYFAPYPVYPSAAYWLTDYMISASLAEAYAAGAASANAAAVRTIQPARLVYASYDPQTGVTSPMMTKDVKDAVAQEIQRELAAQQKAQDPSDGGTSSLATLLADGQHHVFVADAGLTVSSPAGECGLTEGDVLQLAPPLAQNASAADLRVLASKQTDCAKGSTVSVNLDDLQEMQNHLLSNIDKGMAEMKDHPGQGGLPAPPAAVIQGTKPAPYVSAAPVADPNGAAQLDEQSQQGAQLENEAVAEANAPDSLATANSPAEMANVAPAAAPHGGPVTVSLGNTEAQVIAQKGSPLNKVVFPTKTVYIYADMKITFVKGKLTDVQ